MQLRSASARRAFVRNCLRVAAALLLAGPFASPGCKSRQGFGPGLANTRTELRVLDTERLGPYLVGNLDLNGRPFDAFTLPSEACVAVFEHGSTVTYIDNGPQGVYQRGEFRCQGLGVGNLIIWRDRRRTPTTGPVPRAQVTYRVIHEGERHALLRGQFPPASAVGFTGTQDLVAVIPVDGECAPLLRQRAASMEFRARGNRAFSMVGPNGLCEVHGFAQPPPRHAEEAPAS